VRAGLPIAIKMLKMHHHVHDVVSEIFLPKIIKIC